MRNFEYRRPRMETGLNVDFVTNGRTLYGVCSNIGVSGICAEFDSFPAVGSVGDLIIHHPKCVLRRRAQIAYLDKSLVGISFFPPTASETQATRHLLDLVANGPN